MKTRESQTRESRRVEATNAGFETHVKARTREHRRGYELRVALTQEREDHVKELLGRGGCIYKGEK